MRKYRRMTYTDRLIIERLYNSGCSYRAIAKKTGFTPSAIHYEVKRGIYLHRNGKTWEDIPRYSATIADDDAKWQATAKGQMLKLDKRHDYAYLVSRRIKSGESPDQITGDLKRRREWTVSTPTLYRYIDQGFIPEIGNKDLWEKSKKKKRAYRKSRAAKAPIGVSIESRPQAINARNTFGHWEMDTVIGKAQGHDQALLVLTERLTRFEIICKLPTKTANAVQTILRNTIPQYPRNTFQTITVDNGPEFSGYEQLKQITNEVYYCHPFSSWERGSNENANRIIRRFFAKHTSFQNITQKDCEAVAHYMNNLHRKSLGYDTAQARFEAELAKLRTP